MKRILVLLLSLVLLVSAMTACGDKSKTTEEATNESQTEAVKYEYEVRELPEAKYITPASDFAGGDGTESNPYQISNAAELALLHEKIASDSETRKKDYVKACYVLTDDISVNDTEDFDKWETNAPEYSWQPIGFGTDDFTGVFDGDGHTISGLYINTNCEDTSENYGLFARVAGTVKNVTISQSYFAVSGVNGTLGSIAGVLTDTGAIENCNSSAVISCYDTLTGGIVGQSFGGVVSGLNDKKDENEERETRYSSISGCTFTGTITQVKDHAHWYLGGIIGSCHGNIDKCVNNGTINFAADNVDSVGGIAGMMYDGTVSDCKNTGTLRCKTTEESNHAVAGGIIGTLFFSSTGGEKYMSREAAVDKCENSGTVEGQLYAGGIIGQLSDNRNQYTVTVSDCTNSGSVSAVEYSGGVIGYLYAIGKNKNGESIVIRDCENTADLSKGTVGGIIANFMSTSGDVTIKDCKNSGALSSDGQHCGGIISYWMMDSSPSNSHIVIEECENTGEINTTLHAGGIISFMDMPVSLDMGKNLSVSISDCKNSGKITTGSTNGYIGGILGNWGMKDIPTVLSECTNSGTLSITAAADKMTEEEAKIMTISRIAGGIVGRVGRGLLLTTDHDESKEKNVQAKNAVLKITDCKNTGKKEIVNENAPFYQNWFGGIIGNTSAENGFSVLVENCTYTGFERGLGNESLPDVGIKN